MGSMQKKNKNKNKIRSNINNDPTTKEYFDDLQKIFIDNFTKNDNLISNMNTCLREKKFDQDIEEGSPNNLPKEDDQIIYDGQYFVNWLDFLYEYLEGEKGKNRFWAVQMLDKLDNEYFLAENKYLSQFFFEEYGILNIPDCICKEKKRERKINVNTSTLNVTQNLGGSFGDFSLDNEDPVNAKYNKLRNKVKKYISSFKEHTLNKDHPINIVAQIFESVWVNYVNEKMQIMKNKYPETTEKNKYDIEKDVVDLTYQLQRFVNKLQVCLKLFNSRTINFSSFEQENDELINIITTLIFRTGKIYETMFSLYEFSLRREIYDMNLKLQKLKKKAPEDLEVEIKFCLNNQTLDMQEQILKNALKECEIENEKENENKKGVIEINISQNEIEKRKITTLIKIVDDKKLRIPKPGQRNMEDLKVDLDFDDDNSDSDKMMNLYKNDSVFIDNNNYIGEILPKLEENDIYSSSINTSVDNMTLNKGNYNINDQEEENLLISNSSININEKKVKNNGQNNIIIRYSNATQKNIVPFKPERFIGRVSYFRDNNDDFISYPYETAIQLLKQIRKYKAPFEKLMIIASIRNEIIDCVSDFWSEMESYIKKDLLAIEGEQLQIIFAYIIIQSGLKDFLIHLKMVNLFITCEIKKSDIGIYLSTVKAALLNKHFFE